ncbi:arginine N-succinyltransferase [Desulfomarina sp.]
MTSNQITAPPSLPPQSGRSGFSWKQVLIMILISMCVAIFATALAIKIFLFPSPFKPVVLSPKEEQQLEVKIKRFEGLEAAPEKKTDYDKNGNLVPEQYSEEPGSREINFTEREINALMAKNTDLAQKLAIDLADNMISLKLLIPLDPDFPIMGGKTLRVSAGAELAYKNGRPIVKLKGVSLMGVPMPNAWLGGLKNIDLVSEFGGDDGFWQAFADGVDSITVTNGFLKIRLKE